MDNENLDIFISTHKDFPQHVKNSCYKIITSQDAAINTSLDIVRETETELTPREFSYAEGSRLYFLWREYPLKKYVGLCHYRTYFSFMDDIPNLDDLFKKYKVITSQKLDLGCTVAEHYKRCHIIETLFEIGDILTEMFPHLSIPFENFLNQRFLYTRNMFIMKSEDFRKLCEFAFPILLEFDKRHNLTTTEDVKDYIEGKPNTTNLLYQSRLEGFLLERLTSFFLMHNYNELEIKAYPIKTTEGMPDWNKRNQEIKKETLANTNQEKKSSTCILLTACINPNGMAFTALQNTETREKQYREALDFYLTETTAKVVFVENTMQDISHLYRYYIDNGRLEYLCFDGNNYDKNLGKGFGEAKILKHAFLHSRFLNESRYVVKITGRLIVRNINNILAQTNKLEADNCFLCDFREGDTLWSMVFAMNPSMLKEIILKNGGKVNDSKNLYFENVLYNSVLVRHNITVLPYIESPIIDGMCGTNGKSYKETIEEHTHSKYSNPLDENLYQIAKFYIKANREKEYEKVKEYIKKNALK